jgi:hypothetical protein
MGLVPRPLPPFISSLCVLAPDGKAVNPSVGTGRRKEGRRSPNSKMSGLSFNLGGVKRPGGGGPAGKAAAKPKLGDLFGADSDDEEHGQHQDKKQRTSSAAAASTSDPEVAAAVEKLAAFVGKNGRSYEDMTRQKNPVDANTPFK